MPLRFEPDLSVIVPVLSEVAELSGLIAALSTQRGVSFELIICDGGSPDEQQLEMKQMLSLCGYESHFIVTSKGRGRQMNAGARAAKSPLLLFLHADTRFSGHDDLCQSVSFFKKSSAASHCMLAAHFSLCFRVTAKTNPLAFFFYEAKTHLNRIDCIRGDQGFMISRIFFSKIGGFDEKLPFLEDIRFVEAVGSQGEWIELPATVSTSARRFEKEGLRERQTLNAIIVNAHVAGWEEFFIAMPGLYQCHSDSGRLNLVKTLDSIKRLVVAKPPEWQKAFWASTGRHVASNIWQLFFWLDVRASYASGLKAGQTNAFWSDIYERYFKFVCESLPLSILAAAAVQVWLRVMLLRNKN
jgi:rSAM/selenodomain-associated transferase 2